MKEKVIKREEQALDKWRAPELLYRHQKYIYFKKKKIAKIWQIINHKRISLHGKRKRRYNNVIKVLDKDKKKEKYEKHICKSLFLQIQSYHNNENSWRCGYGGSRIDSCFD